MLSVNKILEKNGNMYCSIKEWSARHSSVLKTNKRNVNTTTFSADAVGSQIDSQVHTMQTNCLLTDFPSLRFKIRKSLAYRRLEKKVRGVK